MPEASVTGVDLDVLIDLLRQPGHRAQAVQVLEKLAAAHLVSDAHVCIL